jgi:cell wall-associated NlpC family hydrolase
LLKTEKPTAPTASAQGNEVAKYALQFVGNPYKYGGTSLTNGADCSGFVQSVYAHFNYRISRTSREQAVTAGYMDVSLKESELQPGDLIFYANNSGTVCHVGIYIGDGKIVHAANARKGITVSPYTYMTPYKARRVVG